MKTRNQENKLFTIVEAQQGFFTAHQANEAGVIRTNHSFHVKQGNWIREWRGVYRLKSFPFQDDGYYALWGVWSMNRKGEIQGVYSHETALSIYNLSDANPAKLHMTVPRGFRRHSKIPEVLRLHFSEIFPIEYENHGGYKVTKPFRTIADLVRSGKTQEDFIIQAVKQGLKRGLLTQKQYAGLLDTPRVGNVLRRIIGDN